MMKISINRANKIRNAMENLSIPVTPSINIRTNTPEILEEKLQEGEEDVMNTIHLLEKRCSHVKVIRDLIRKANDEHGITDIIAELAMIEQQISVFNKLSADLKGASRYSSSADDYMAIVEHRKNIPVAEATPHKAVAVRCSNTGEQYINENLLKLKLYRNDLQEKRNALNHSNYIELPGEMVEFLKGRALM